MFGMGMPEILLILAIALIVIGPKKLPDLAKSLGRAMNEFKHAANEFKDSMDLDNDIREVKKSFDDVEAELKKKTAVEIKPESAPPQDAEAQATDDQILVKPVDTALETDQEIISPQPTEAKKGIDVSPSSAPPGKPEEEFYAATDIPAELMEAEEKKDHPISETTVSGTDQSHKKDGEA
jgi:Tat protein translocase TatB subunit